MVVHEDDGRGRELERPAHDLARRLVSLPCDHRYGEEDMARVVRAVRQVQAGAR